VDEYAIDFNATQAAIRAGYSPKTAYSIGAENLTKPEIKAALQAAQSAVATRTTITKDYLIEQANDILLKAKVNGAWSAAKGGGRDPRPCLARPARGAAADTRRLRA
jgi:phage terminase small subunit